MPTIARIAITPVKGLGLLHPEHVLLDRNGVAENRRFYLVDDHGRLFNGSRHGLLVQVRSFYKPEADTLRLEFPDGEAVDGPIELGRPVRTNFWDERVVPGHKVLGPFAAALSTYAGRPASVDPDRFPGRRL